MHGENRAVMWSQPNCQYCDMALALLERKGYSVSKREIGEAFTKQDLLKAVPNARSVPQIFVNDKYVGGYAALTEFLG